MSNQKIVVPDGFNIVMPYLLVADVEDAIDFYARAFGFRPGEVMKDESGVANHGEFSYHGQVMMCGRQDAMGESAKTPRAQGVPSPMSLYLYCADVDSFFEAATNAGAISRGAPEDTFWGDRMCRLEDPSGYIWAFATAAPSS